MTKIDTVEFVVLPSRSNKETCTTSSVKKIKLTPFEEKMVLPITFQKGQNDQSSMKSIKDWIDSKYHIGDVCFDKESPPGNSHQLCSKKYWSSIGHDPFESNNL